MRAKFYSLHRAKLSASGARCKVAHDLKGRVYFGFTIVDLARLANAELIPHGADPDSFPLPQFLFELSGRDAFDAVDHNGAGELGMNGGDDFGTRNALEPLPETVSQRADTLAHTLQPYAETKVERGVEGGLQT